jgi:hypothetical protein
MKHRPAGSAYTQGQCRFFGCVNKQRQKGKSPDGKKLFDVYCDLHHRLRFGIRSPEQRSRAMSWKVNIPNDKCSRCGWSEGPCDRHRLIPENGYVPGNIKILCPNCHRLVTLGIIKL